MSEKDLVQLLKDMKQIGTHKEDMCLAEFLDEIEKRLSQSFDVNGN